jgi:hypothetical protein
MSESEEADPSALDVVVALKTLGGCYLDSVSPVSLVSHSDAVRYSLVD